MNTANEKSFSTYSNPNINDLTYILESKKIFKELISKNIIITTHSFQDNNWKISNELKIVSLNFDFPIFFYKNYQNIFELSYGEFIIYFKCFVINKIGTLVIRSLQGIVSTLNQILSVNPSHLQNFLSEKNLPNLIYIIEFFTSLNIANKECKNILSIFQNYWNSYLNRTVQQRQLSAFDTYFTFDFLIKDFWANRKSENDALYFFPIYLWWEITAIIPQRPTELIVTPLNCIEQKNDKFYITLRKTKLKGAHKEVYYQVDKDYKMVQYQITPNLYKEIDFYIKHTNSTSGFLFDRNILETKKSVNNPFGNSNLFTYSDLKKLLKTFYKQILIEKYQYKIIKKDNLNNIEKNTFYGDKYIEKINLGDTRHLALINLIQSGTTPYVAAILAGHSDIDITSHYFSNISTLIESKVYQKYYASDNVNFEIFNFNNNLLPKSNNTNFFIKLSNGGVCTSSKFINNNFEDCFNTSGDYGEIGDCSKCKFFVSNYIKLEKNIENKFLKQQIETDYKILMESVESFRKFNGTINEIGTTLLKIQNSFKSYENFLINEILIGEKYGKT